MPYGLLYALGIILLTMSSFATSHAQVQSQKQVTAAPLPVVPTAPGPYYALPSWDQKLPSHARFIILSDWGVLLFWTRRQGLYGSGRRAQIIIVEVGAMLFNIVEILIWGTGRAGESPCSKNWEVF
jgi:hypothetical protein